MSKDLDGNCTGNIGETFDITVALSVMISSHALMGTTSI